MTYLHQYDSWNENNTINWTNGTNDYKIQTFWCVQKQRYCIGGNCSTCYDYFPIWYPYHPQTERHHAEACPICHGTGKQTDKDCHGCNGKGWVEVRG